ncbi:MAG: alkaline phosphatase family protein, partial [Eubacteriales bacterium]|nr:alkaline phosphatase family protein [Eubacteriales bacterium]
MTGSVTKNKRLLLISLDAVTSGDLDILASLPNFSEIRRRGTLVKDVASVFISNTYPAHASVITGLHPTGHGLVENVVSTPPRGGRNEPPWRYKRKYIKAETLYDRATHHGMKVCSILYPSTGNANIRYNLPEIPGKMGMLRRAALMLLCG